MGLSQLPLFLGGDFNKNYTEIKNSVISGPPHYTGRVPFNFFIKKRYGLHPTLSPNVDEIYEERYYNGSWYILGKIGTNVVWTKNNEILLSKPYSANCINKIIDIGSVKGTPVESGTAAEGVALSGSVEVHLLDSTKSWTENAYAGKFLYIYSATAGQGIITEILSNTATQLFPATGFVSLPGGVTKYYIFDSYEPVFAYNMSDGVYISHDDTTAMQLKIQNITPAENITTGGGRIFWYTTQGNIYVTNTGYNNLILNIENYYIATQPGILDMVEYKEYVILLSLDAIDLIKTEYLQLSTGDSTVSQPAFKIVNATRAFGEHNRGAYVIYNQGLYVMSRRGKFIAINIAPVTSSTSYTGIEEFLVTQQDQGVNIQKYLDPYKFTATYRISIDDDEINIVQTDPALGDIRRIFKYDFSYQGWHFWETEVPIKYVANRSIGYSYVGDNIYEPYVGNYFDGGSTEYTQSIKLMLHEDTLFNVKHENSLKLYVGHLFSQNTNLSINYFLSGHITNIQKDFSSSVYLNSVRLIGLSGEDNNPVLNYGTRSSLDDQESLISGTAIVEIPLGIKCELLEINLIATGQNQIHMGGSLLVYELFDSHLTSKFNTI